MSLPSAAVVTLLALQTISRPTFNVHCLQAVSVLQLQDCANLLAVFEAPLQQNLSVPTFNQLYILFPVHSGLVSSRE